MSYTTYLFDFDYTLADSSRGIVLCFRNVLTLNGYTEVTDEQIKRTIGKTLEESFSLLTGVTDACRLADFKAAYVKEADTHMTVNTFLFPETEAVLTALKASGARIGIISTKYRYRIRELLDRHFPEGFIDIIVGGEDVKAAKPSPEGLLFAIGQLHADKASTLYIGDSTVDAETAQAAGVDFAGITHGVTTREELAAYPHLLISDTLEELPGLPALSAPVPSTVLRKKRLISIWQFLILLPLLGLSYVEGSDVYVFKPFFVLALWGILQKRRMLPDKVKAFIEPAWHPCAVRLRAFRIRLIQGGKVPPADSGTCTCLNCGTTYTGNYCSRCGQSRYTSRFRLSNALTNIAGGFFNIDHGFGRTLLELLYRPGYMMADYIGGKRARYFRPFQTLFILAALYIMTVQLVDPEALRLGEKQAQTEQEEIVITQKKLNRKLEQTDDPKEKESIAAGMEILEDYKDGLDEKDEYTSVMRMVGPGPIDDGPIDKFVKDSSEMGKKWEKFFQNSPFLQKVWDLLKSWAHGNKAFRIIATLPLFALATQLAFYRRKRKRNYNTTEHLFIQAYIACQILLLSIVVLPFNGYAEVDDLYELPLWMILALFCWDYKQLYRYTWWRSFWHTILMLVYSLVLIIAFAFLVIMLMLAGIYVLEYTV